jgi:hypothetical protein
VGTVVGTAVLKEWASSNVGIAENISIVTTQITQQGWIVGGDIYQRKGHT